jgi:hypothetical protein
MKWSGFLRNRASISVVVWVWRKSSSGADMTSAQRSLRRLEGGGKVATDPLASVRKPTDQPCGTVDQPTGGRFGVRGKDGRQVDGLEGNFWVMEPGIPLNGN